MSRKIWYWTIQGTLAVGQFLAIQTAWAQAGADGGVGSGGTSGVTLPNPLGQSCSDLGCPIDKILSILFTIGIPLTTIMVLWGGFKLVTSAGDPEKAKEGRKTILYAAIGFVVILLANSIPGFLKAFFVQ